MKSWKIPTPEEINRAVALLSHREQYRYFFDRLENPEWIAPLKSKGFFTNPPGITVDEKRGTIATPPWPESRYLSRMAALKPDLVLETILQVPDTRNPSVHEDFVEAALTMPPKLAARLVPKLENWIQSPRSFLNPDNLGSLISHLARTGQEADAIAIARIILAIIASDEVEAELPGGTYRTRREPEGRFDSWYYKQILEKNIPDLVAASGEKALLLLCDLLDAAVKARRPTDENSDAEDYSYIWRAAIEDHVQNQSFGITTMLVSAVRDAAEAIAKTDPSKVPALVRTLEAYRWSVFQRIALHLLRLFPDAAPSQIIERLTDRKRFDQLALDHEYVPLLQSQFAALGPENQETILAWIEDGPNLEIFKENEKEITGKEPTEADIRKFVRRWQFQQLAPLRHVISSDWKKRYDDLIQEFGEPKDREYASYSTGWIGPTSPKDTADLRSMSVEELVDFLKTWKPSNDPTAPTPEGLARELTNLIASDPQRFAEEINKFRNVGPYTPTYVRGLLSGLRDAVTQRHSFSWPRVLALCSWVVDQPRENYEQQTGHLEHDPHWGWAQKRIPDLLEQGFQYGPTEIPFDLREKVWNILEPITDDPEPTPDYEARYGGSNMDPATLSINTTRGEAMHALVRYALWVRHHIEKEPDARDRLARGFHEMPEVRHVLDAHLATDPSLAIRSVYGRFFPWLFLLDADWTKAKVGTIFPLSDSLQSFFDAAWNTYIVFCQPYDDVLAILKPIYAHAIEQLGGELHEKSQTSDPEHHLAAHLITYYWRGKLEINDATGLLQLFWSKAEPKLRGYALEHAGRSLSNTKAEIPEEIIARFRQLWEFRFQTAKASSQPSSHKDELAAFSWWFASGKFDDIWALQQLENVLKLVNKIDYPKFVVERLVAMASRLPRESVEGLKLTVGSELEPWEIYGWRDEAKQVLATAIQSTDKQARDAAIELVHELGKKGHFEFREVLPKI